MPMRLIIIEFLRRIRVHYKISKTEGVLSLLVKNYLKSFESCAMQEKGNLDDMIDN